MEPKPSLMVFTIQIIVAIPLYILWGATALWVRNGAINIQNKFTEGSNNFTQGKYILASLFLRLMTLITYILAMLVTPLLILWTVIAAFGYNFWGWYF